MHVLDNSPAREAAKGLLDAIGGPVDVRLMPAAQLPRLAAEIRGRLIDDVSRTGGHLGPNLGVVELTIALHRVFDSPHDRILFDTGHQSYVHKMLTGRVDALSTLRQAGGLSGYPSRTESSHDIIENSHASTALSYADGLAKGYALRGEQRRVVALVGDGALTGGMAWEALNNLGAGGRQVIVVLNDNGRSYGPTVGGLASHLAELRAGRTSTRDTVFHNFGLAYLGPVDGHDAPAVEAALRQATEHPGATVVHCVTSKGNGYVEAERDEVDRFHAVPGRRTAPTVTGVDPAAGASWTSVFSREMLSLGESRPDVVGVTAAMLHPVGLAAFAHRYPDRVFDVGIAEQHAATSAAGLAMTGLHPVVAIYATFLNRAFDQILMDVALHRCGVTFVADRAGITGEDGPSHNGVWDLSLFSVVPGLRVAAPRDATQLGALLREAVEVHDAPTLVRFPKGAVGPDLPALATVGRGHLLHGTLDRDADILLVAVGAAAGACLRAAALLAAAGITVSIVDPRWAVPADAALVDFAASHRLVVTVEDNSRRGGAGALLSLALRDAGQATPVRCVGVPARFLPQGTRGEILDRAELTAEAVAATAMDFLHRCGAPVAAVYKGEFS